MLKNIFINECTIKVRFKRQCVCDYRVLDVFEGFFSLFLLKNRGINNVENKIISRFYFRVFLQNMKDFTK